MVWIDVFPSSKGPSNRFRPYPAVCFRRVFGGENGSQTYPKHSYIEPGSYMTVITRGDISGSSRIGFSGTRSSNVKIASLNAAV